MRTLSCDTCAKPIAPTVQQCAHCGAWTRYDSRRRTINFSIVFGFFILLMLIGWCSKASAQGFYAGADLNGTLTRCVDASAEWAGCTDAG